MMLYKVLIVVVLVVATVQMGHAHRCRTGKNQATKETGTSLFQRVLNLIKPFTNGFIKNPLNKLHPSNEINTSVNPKPNYIMENPTIFEDRKCQTEETPEEKKAPGSTLLQHVSRNLFKPIGTGVISFFLKQILHSTGGSKSHSTGGSKSH